MANENDEFKADDPFDESRYSDLRNAIDQETQVTRSSFADAALDERAFIADTGEQTVSDVLRALVENPTTDHLIVITRLEWFNGGTNDHFGQIFKNPTTDLPTTERNYANLYSKADNSEPATQANFFFDDGSVSMSGGDATGTEITFSTGDNRQDFVYVLEPQASVGVNIDTGGSLTSETVKFTIFYIEVPL